MYQRITHMNNINIKHLISPFALWLPPVPSMTPKAAMSRPMCNCDSDEENDFGMAPECAFACNSFKGVTRNGSAKKNTSKKLRSTTKRFSTTKRRRQCNFTANCLQ